MLSSLQITVIHHSSGGSLEKAKKYAEKALSQIEILNSSNEFTDQQDQSASSSTSTSGGGSNHSLHDQLLLKLHVMLIESAVQCDLVMGQKQLAIKKVPFNCPRMRNNYCKRVCLFNANFSLHRFALFFQNNL